MFFLQYFSKLKKKFTESFGFRLTIKYFKSFKINIFFSRLSILILFLFQFWFGFWFWRLNYYGNIGKQDTTVGRRRFDIPIESNVFFCVFSTPTKKMASGDWELKGRQWHGVARSAWRAVRVSSLIYENLATPVLSRNLHKFTKNRQK